MTEPDIMEMLCRPVLDRDRTVQSGIEMICEKVTSLIKPAAKQLKTAFNKISMCC